MIDDEVEPIHPTPDSPFPAIHDCPQCGRDTVNLVCMSAMHTGFRGLEYFCMCMTCAAAGDSVYDLEAPVGDEPHRAIDNWNSDRPKRDRPSLLLLIMLSSEDDQPRSPAADALAMLILALAAPGSL